MGETPEDFENHQGHREVLSFNKLSSGTYQVVKFTNKNEKKNGSQNTAGSREVGSLVSVPRHRYVLK